MYCEPKILDAKFRTIYLPRPPPAKIKFIARLASQLVEDLLKRKQIHRKHTKCEILESLGDKVGKSQGFWGVAVNTETMLRLYGGIDVVNSDFHL